MKIILETTNDKIFVNYDGQAIDALLNITKGHTSAPHSIDGQMICRYTDTAAGKVISLYMSKYFNYGIYEAEQLSSALDSGIADDTTYQLERISSQSLPFNENGLPGLIGEGFST